MRGRGQQAALVACPQPFLARENLVLHDRDSFPSQTLILPGFEPTTRNRSSQSMAMKV